MKNSRTPTSDHPPQLPGHQIVVRSKVTVAREQEDRDRLQHDASVKDQEISALREETTQVEKALGVLEGEIDQVVKELADLAANRERLARQHADASNRRKQLLDAIDVTAAEANERWARVADKEEMLRFLVLPKEGSTPIHDETAQRYQTGPQPQIQSDLRVADRAPAVTQISPAVREQGR